MSLMFTRLSALITIVVSFCLISCNQLFAEKVLLDFEAARDVNIWDVKSGEGVSLSDTSPLNGKHALQIPLDCHITTSLLPRDWSGHTALEIQYNNTLKTPVSLYLVIADMAWLEKKGYWNQYNNFFLLDAGKGSLQVPLAELFRGQKDRRNLDIKSNIDLATIVRVEMEFKGEEGLLYLDDMKLVGGSGEAAAAAPTPSVPVPTLPTPAAPAVAAAPAPPATPAPAIAVPAYKTWVGFENLRDIGMWEVRTGPKPEAVSRHVTEGSKALQCYPSNLLATHGVPRDWRTYETMEFDVYNECKNKIKLELLIGDDAWIGEQNYWNRYNRVYTLAPGANHIEISVDNLYRGEGSARNRGSIKRNLDLHQINFISFKFEGKASYGNLYFDNIRFKNRGGVVAAAAPVAPAVPGQPVPAAPAAAAPAAAAGGDRLIMGFESSADIHKWEVRQGNVPVIDTKHVTQGEKTLRVRGGHILATFSLPRDWTQHEALEFDIFNEAENLHKMEIVVGDDAFMADQNYWNRHNAIFMLVPGENKISIPVNGLYRGEAGARNRGTIPRNIDPNMIAFMSITFHGRGRDAPLFMDNMCLVGGGGGGGVVMAAPPTVHPVPAPVPAPAPVPVPVPAQPAPAYTPPPAIAAGGDRLLMGFETAADIHKWEVRQGNVPVIDVKHVTEGQKTLRVRGGHILATFSLPRDWSAHEALEFDIFNEADKLHKLEIAIGDEAFMTSQNYWNRYNAVFMLVPGENKISIPVGGLYRGEAAARNRGTVPGNIDSRQITFMSMTFHGKGRDAPLFMDNFRLSGGAGGGVIMGGAPRPVPAAPPVAVPAPIPAPVPAYRPPAAAPVVGAAGGDKLIMGFETAADIYKWEIRQGNAPVIDTKHATEGEKTMRLRGGHILASFSLPRDWSRHEALEFDIFNEADKLHKMEITIGDEAFMTSQDYWNRYNAVFMLVPGENKISIPVTGLYRGEAAARNRGTVPGNIDSRQITMMTITFHGKGRDAPLFMDNFRLSGGGGVVLGGAPSPAYTPTPAPAPAYTPAPAPVPTPAVQPPAAPPVAAAAAGDLLLMGFETAADVHKWETRQGSVPIIDTKHVTQGEKSLRVRGGHVLATFSLPGNWTPYEALEFDLFNEADKLHKMEIAIGDAAFMGNQNYWNRYNAVFMLVPGENKISIPVTGLYRGEAAARNRGTIPGNLDTRQIGFMSITFHGKGRDAPLFMDNFRLSAGGGGAMINQPAPAPVPTPPAPAIPVSVPAPAPLAVALPSQAAPSQPATPPQPATPTAQADEVWYGFEEPIASFTNRWELREGPIPEVSSEHATEGGQSLKVLPGCLIATKSLPNDWRAYEALEFDVFNGTEGLVKLEMVVGDSAWLDKMDYWNRHNAIYMLVPGENIIHLPVEGLYRGEAGARNRDIKRNIDADQIRFLSFWFQGAANAGPLFLDHCRLVAGNQIAVSTPTGSGPTVKQFFDFETLQDTVKWEVRAGGAPVQAAEHPTAGKHSLKVRRGGHIATTNLPRDWSRYQVLEFDVFHPGDDLVKLELMIGDDAWSQKADYWNRHNAIYNLVPGANTISVPVNGLYRGEAGARNRDIKRNIDANQINVLSLNFHGKGSQGFVYLDNLRLRSDGGMVLPNPGPPVAGGQAAVPAAGPAATPPANTQIWGFDFGPKDQQLWPGFHGITWNTLYSKEMGFGLEKSQNRSRFAQDTTWPTRLLQDFLWIPYGDFLIDVPNGAYDVWVFFEESGYWAEEHSVHVKRAIYAEGKEVVMEDRTERGPNGESLYLFEDFEPVPGVNVLREYWDRLYQPRAFSTRVSDGQLNIGVYAEAQMSCRVSAIIVHPTGDAKAIAWKQQLMEKNFREMNSKAAMHPFPKPSGLDKMPPAAFTQPAMAYIADPEYPFRLTQAPSVDQLGTAMAQRGAQGETVSVSFGIRPNKDLGLAQSLTSDLKGSRGVIPASAVVVRAVRHMAKRPFGDRSFSVKPWYLSDVSGLALPKELNRQFWVTVAIPKGQAAGRYSGSVQIKTDTGYSQNFTLDLTVMPFSLVKPDIPICFFGMPPDSLDLLKDYGVTAVNGGPRIRFHRWNKETKQPILDFKQVDAYLAKAKANGMNLEVMDYNGPITLDGLNYHNAFAFFKEKGHWVGLDPLEAGKRTFDMIKAHAEKAGWPSFTYNMVDEPLNSDTTKANLGNVRFMRQIAPWMKLIGYYNFNFKNDRLGNDQLFKALDGTVCKTYNTAVLDYAAKNDKSLYLYSLGRTRYTFGPYLFRHRQAGVKGYVQWHSYIVHGYQFFDLDGREPDDGIIVYRTEGVRPTLDLEHIRMGINDYRYILTLEAYAKKARAMGKGVELADQADAMVRAVTDKIGVNERGRPGWLNLDDFRLDITKQILLIKKATGI